MSALTVDFKKMHGLGNDFIIVDGRTYLPPLTPEQIARASDRHFGIGCDQFIVLEPPQSAEADVFMRIYNQDGTEAGACGNATRCVADLVMTELGTLKIVIETISGLLPSKRVVDEIEVDMGPARLDWQEVPLANDCDTAAVPIKEGPLEQPVAVSMGNPHAVFFVDGVEDFDLATWGPKIENHKMFPNRANVEIVEVLGPNHLRQRTWERSVGETLACGSGACAVAVAAVQRGITDRKCRITLNGGDLGLTWREDGHVLMRGPFAYAFEGRIVL